MTREEIMTLDMEQVQKRGAEIAEELATCDEAGIEERKLEMDALEERKKAIEAEAIEKRAKMLEAVAEGVVIEEPKEEKKKMTDREIRNTKEYIDAYVEYVKSGYDKRAAGAVLMTENATDGTIAVPTYLEDRINAAWENNEILRRCRRTFFPGNVKVGVEVNAPMAVIHEEGAEAIPAEELQIEFVNLVPDYAKKMIQVTHNALELTGTAFLDYLYDEIEAKIFELIAASIVKATYNSNYATPYSLEEGQTSVTAADIYNAEGRLGAGATDPVVITTRSTAAALKAAALAAGYGYDPFDGMPVLYVDASVLSALGDAKALIVDLSGVQVNFPDGDQPKFIFDEFTLAAENIVRIVGRLAFAADLVATGKAVKVALPST